MQPYTPHGDSNIEDTMPYPEETPMQPYTPHGDSNDNSFEVWASTSGCNLIPLTGTATSAERLSVLSGDRGCNLIPLTGTATDLAEYGFLMYIRCNLIPLTGTVTDQWPQTHVKILIDATLHPSRGQ